MDAQANAVKVRHAFNALHSGTEGLSAFPVFLLEIINDEAWREVARPGPAEPETFERFGDWVVALPPTGLGASRQLLERICKNTDAEVPLRKALMEKDGPRPSGELTNNISKSRATKQGTSHSYTLDRLEREHPDLKARVDAEELTANQAAIQAGFRPRTFTVRADSTASIAATLRKQLDPKVLQELIKLLSERTQP